MKICAQCRIPQLPNQFHKRERSSDGLVSRCKTCVLTRMRNYYGQVRKVRSYARVKSLLHQSAELPQWVTGSQEAPLVTGKVTEHSLGLYDKDEDPRSTKPRSQRASRKRVLRGTLKLLNTPMDMREPVQPIESKFAREPISLNEPRAKIEPKNVSESREPRAPSNQSEPRPLESTTQAARATLEESAKFSKRAIL